MISCGKYFVSVLIVAFNFMGCFQTGFTVLDVVRQPSALRTIQSVSAETKQKGGRLPPLKPCHLKVNPWVGVKEFAVLIF